MRALLGLSDDRDRDCAEIDRIAEAHLLETADADIRREDLLLGAAHERSGAATEPQRRP